MVTFNGETNSTDANGKVSYIVEPGTYAVSATKIHLDPVENLTVEILESTTIIPVYMDSTLYDVTFLVEEEETGEALSFADVSFGSQSKTTGTDGRVQFGLNAGSQTGNFSKLNFSDLDRKFVIESDQLFEVELTRTHAEVKIRLRNGQQPVAGALVQLAGETLTSSPVGTVVFPSVGIHTDQPYSIQKEYYFTLEGTVNVNSDTTIELQMSESVANITFVVTAETGTIMNGYAVIASDTAWANTENRATFYNIEILTEHQYIVGSDHFEPSSGSVFLEGDTIIQVMLTPVAIANQELPGGPRIYPNPATTSISIELATGRIDQVALVDITGKTILQRKFEGMNNVVDLQLDIPAGLYFVKISDSQETVTRRLIIR